MQPNCEICNKPIEPARLKSARTTCLRCQVGIDSTNAVLAFCGPSGEVIGTMSRRAVAGYIHAPATGHSAQNRHRVLAALEPYERGRK